MFSLYGSDAALYILYVYLTIYRYIIYVKCLPDILANVMQHFKKCECYFPLLFIVASEYRN